MPRFIPKFIGEVSGGKLKLDEEQKFKMYIASLSGPVYVVVSKPQDTRTLPQNDLLHGYIRLVCDETGDPDFEGMKEYLKKTCGVLEIKTKFGKEEKIVKSTAIYTKEEMDMFFKKAEVLTGVPVPDTKKVSYE